MRQNVLLRRRRTTWQVTFPDRTSFLARYERLSRQNLPSNMTITRTISMEPRSSKRREKAETGESLIGNIARGMANLG